MKRLRRKPVSMIQRFEAAVQTISNQIDALLPEGYTATVNVAEGDYTAPVAGTADNPKGTAGSITYTVTITSDTMHPIQ